MPLLQSRSALNVNAAERSEEGRPPVASVDAQDDPIAVEYADPGDADTVVIDWTIGNICNQSCSYCPSRLRDGSHGWQSARDLSTMLRRIERHYAQGLGKRVWIHLTGGEPTLHPHFQTFLIEAKALGVAVSVASNASRTRMFWDRVAPHLDAAILTFHSRYADLPHIVEVASGLSRKLPVRIEVPALTERFGEVLEQARSLASDLPDVPVVLTPLRRNMNETFFDYSESQWQHLGRPVSHGHGQAPVPPNVRMCLRGRSGREGLNPEGFLRQGPPSWKGLICNAGIDRLSIASDGSILRARCGVGGASRSLPVSPIRCDKAHCRFPEDLAIPKRPQHGLLAQ